MRKALVAMMLSACLAGCGVYSALIDGFQQAGEVASDLKQSIGVAPGVQFTTRNGSLSTVTLTFNGIPAGMTTEQIAQISKQAIATRFGRAPQQIVIAFTLPGS